MGQHLKQTVIPGLIACAATLGYGGAAFAQLAAVNTITVTTLDDELNNDNDCSLREAIQASNINEPVDNCAGGIPGSEGADQIEFDPQLAGGTIVLDLFGSDFEDNNATGDLDILDGHLIIAGPGTGPGSIIIDGAGDQVPAEFAPHRVLHVPPTGTFYASIELRDVTIRNGRIDRANADANGGGVNIEPQAVCESGPDTGPCLSLLRTDIIGNSVSSTGEAESSGGGLYFNVGRIAGDPAEIGINNVRLNSNSVSSEFGAFGGGASIADNDGFEPRLPFSVLISDTEFNQNSVTSSRSVAVGGGLELDISAITDVSIEGSNFSRNTSTAASGAEGAGASIFLGSSPMDSSRIDVLSSVFNDNLLDAGIGKAVGGGISLIASGNLFSVFMRNNDYSLNELTASIDSVFSPDAGSIQGGGANLNIFADGSTTGSRFVLSNNNFSSNTLIGDGALEGGGLFLDTIGIANSEITNSRFSSNRLEGPGDGGGARLRIGLDRFSVIPAVIINNSEFASNTITSTDFQVLGGGLSLEPLTTDNGEVVAGGCPPEFLMFFSDCIFLNNITVSRNRAESGTGEAIGGGIFTFEKFSANNITVTENVVSGPDANGGGVFADGDIDIRLANSVIAQNLADGPGPDCASEVPNVFVSQGFNFIGIDERCNIVAQPSDQIGTVATPIDAGLDELNFVGDSFTRVHLPFGDSPLVDAGNPDAVGSAETFGSSRPACEAIDQIGTSRPVDGDGDDQPVCDIGAAELITNLPPQIENPIQDRVILLGEDFNINLDTVFTDPEGQTLTYVAFAESTNVAAASISGSTLFVSAVNSGSTVVSVTAIDDQNQQTVDDFQVVVPGEGENQPPSILSGIPDQNLPPGGESSRINLSQVFSDPEGDELFFEAVSNNPNVVTVEIDGSDLILIPGETGVALVTVTAFDTAGQSANIRLKSLAGDGASAAGGSGAGGSTLGSSGGGGCTLRAGNNAAVDPVLWMLAMLAFIALGNRRLSGRR